MLELTTFLPAGLVFLIRARTPGQMLWFLPIGILPTVSGILALYFKLHTTLALKSV